MRLTRVLCRVVAAAAVCTTLFGGSASAAISPDPYVSTADTGSFTSRSAFGTSSCSISAAIVRLVGTTGGASGTIEGLSLSNCRGLALTATAGLVTASAPVHVTIDRGVVTLRDLRLLISNIMGHACLYQGDLTGTIVNGGRYLLGANPSLRLVQALGTSCYTGLDINVSLNLGASISW